jgi:lysine N6-hydroxylase
MTYDLLGIGLGPFNLGLAALSADISRFTTCFIDQQEEFNWHPGLLLPGARLQVPFYADLVTLVQPTSRFSWFSFLQAKQRLFRFGVQDNPFPFRREYNEYGQWVAAQLRNLHWNKRCESVTYDESEEAYNVHVLDLKTGAQETFHAKQLVIGIGSTPYWPTCVDTVIKKEQSPTKVYLSRDKNPSAPFIFHASDYLFNKAKLTTASHITIIGSGQSAAEIFQDILNELPDCPLSWITRSPRFFPMEATPAAFELSSPDYREHFYNLPPAMKEFILAGQDALYKGINANLLSTIYQQLYDRSLGVPGVQASLMPNCELVAVEKYPVKEIQPPRPLSPFKLACIFRHLETDKTFQHTTDALILATGYQETPPTFLDNVKDRINYCPSGKFDVSRDYSITTDKSIFVQNADLHSHGFAASDLSFGPYRNAVILNAILGYDHYRLEKQTTFQHFNPGSD